MNNIWLVGTGLMGREYSKVLQALNVSYIAIGRSETNVYLFEKETNHKAVVGGIEKFLQSDHQIPDAVIVAVDVPHLVETTIQLIQYGIKNILLEKPGICFADEITELAELAAKNKVNLLIAYNRRFYSSVFECEKIIKDDGGVTSFCFEFTEWAHVIEKLDKPKEVLSNWFLGNSTHVVDTAFFLCGEPEQLAPFHKSSTSWHPSGSVYAGAGISKTGALFSYHANWESAGRWAVEVLTRKHRLYLKPMESLQIQNLGSVALETVLIDNSLDVQFKPGFYLQVKSFLQGDYSRFCTIAEQQRKINQIYRPMSGY